MSKPFKIFVDCHVFDGGFQGTRTYIKGLYTELIHDKALHFFMAAQDPSVLKNEFGIHPNVTYLQYKTGNKFKRLLIEMPRLIRQHKVDFAHFQYRVPPLKRCKYIVTTHDVLFEDFPQYFPLLNRISSLLTYKYSARIADLVFTVSQFSKDEISNYLGVHNAVIMPNGVDEVFYENYDTAAARNKVKNRFGFENYWIYISRREPRKGQHLLLKKFVDLKIYERRQLVFVGHQTFANPEFDKIYNALSDAVKAKISFFDRLDFKTTLLLLRASSGVVYPSIAEGFGIPPLEAAAARIPVLCSNQTAMADFTVFANHLFNPLDEAEFQEKLMDFDHNPPSETLLRERADEISRQYNWKIAAEIFRENVQKIR